MKKKVLALVAALTVLTVGATSVFAASPSVGTVAAPVSTQTAATEVAATASAAEYAAATTASAGYEVKATSATTVQAAAVAAQNQLLTDLATVGTALGNSAVVSAATDSTKKVTASVLSVVDVNASTATKDASGKYVVTLNIASIAAGDTIAVLHYNGTAWETIVPTSVAAGSVTFATASLSPISVVKLEVASVTASPKTGSTLPVAAMVIVFALAGAAVCGKKYFA